MAALQDNNALLIFRVGPVYCCAPTLPVEAIIQPPHLTHPPGSSSAQPGIFKHGAQLVSVVDLRHRFGLDEDKHAKPGRIVITQLNQSSVGFWVDGIIDVLETPTQGWGNLPPHLPRGVFSRTLLLDNKIHLYAEFEKLHSLQQTGYLRDYIDQLESHKVAAKASSTVIRAPHKANSSHTTSEIQQQPDRIHPTPARVQDTPGSVLTDKVTPIAPPSTSSATPAVNKERANQSQSRPPSVTAATPPVSSHSSRPLPQTSTLSVATTPGKTNQRETNHSQLNTSGGVSNRTPVTTTPISANLTRELQPNTLATQSHMTDEADEDAGNAGILVIMFSLLLLTAGGSYYLLSSHTPQPDVIASPTSKPSSTITSYEKTVGDNADTTETVTHASREFTKQSLTNAPHLPDNLSQQQSTANVTEMASDHDQQSNSRYRASIRQDAEGITIVLTEPGITATDIKQHSASTDYSVGAIIKPETLTTTTITTTPADGSNTAANDTSRNTSRTTVASNTQSNVTPSTGKKSLRVKTIVHIVVKGDTLWDIAKRYVNNPFLYPELARLSNIKNPDRIYPGNKVRIIQYKK